jgi:multiple sugar transport system permease protein
MNTAGRQGAIEARQQRPRVHPILRTLLGAETPGQVHEALAAYGFISPWVLGLLLFFGGPIIASLILSFFDYSLVAAPKFVGLANFRMAFLEDRLFWPSLGRTFYWSIIFTPIVVFGSLLLSMLLNQKMIATNFFRTLFFLPHLTPSVSLVVLWAFILHPRLGPLNYILGQLGLGQPGWLSSPTWAMPALIMMGLWGGLGGNRMLIFLAGLQGVPQELYEAAEIDGAGNWARFRNVTLPMISPVVFFNIILGIISALQVFTTAFVATEGGPAYATWFLALHIYNQAFRYFRMGYGSTLAWILAAILVVFTYAQMKLSERWVYYAAS